MGEVYPLDSLIKKVNSKTRANNQNEKLVIIDTNSGKEKRSFFARDVEYFLVANTKGSRNYADNSFCHELSDFETDFNLELRVNYRVSCEPGNEVQVAEALWDNIHPGAELERQIKKYIDDFFSYSDEDEIANIISNYSEVIRRLKQNISQKISREIGLNVRLKISFDKEDNLRNVRIASPHFPVQFRDYPEQLDLKFELELSVSESSKINAILKPVQADKLEKIVQNEIKRYLLENTSVEEFYGELDTTLRQNIIWHLDKVLADCGRQVAHLSLKNEITSLPIEDFFEIEHEVRCYAQEEQVIVKNHVQMMPESIGKYRMAKSPNLKRWVEKNLDTVIKSILFDKKYVDVLLDFYPIRGEIKDEIVKRAETIGYSVKHIASVPNLEPLSLQKEFSLEVEDIFETKQEKVKVKLSIIVNAKIDDLTKIKNLLNSRVDVKASMRDDIERVTRSFLHTIEPERFYMRFFYTDDEHPEEEFSVEKEIEKIIKEELEGDYFHAKVKSVTPKPIETEVTQRVTELQGKLCPFEFEVTSLKGGEPVKFQGDIQVETIHKDRWLIFQSRKYELEEIKNNFEKHIKAKLATINQQALQYEEGKDKDALETLLNKWGNNYIIEQFGLEVRIVNVSRKLTSLDRIKNQRYGLGVRVEQEKLKEREYIVLAPFIKRELDYKYIQEIESKLDEAKKLELDQLLTRRRTLKLREGNEEELANIDRQIYEIEQIATQSSTKITESEDYLLESETSGSGETSFSEIAENMDLSGNNNRFTLNPDKGMRYIQNKDEDE